MPRLECTKCGGPLPWELEGIVRHIAREEIMEANTPPTTFPLEAWAGWFNRG